jgi:ankyrin repeat protein
LKQRNETGSTLLHQACHQGQAEIVEMLLEYECDVNARNRFGQTPLHIACSSHPQYRKDNIVQSLFEAGADASILDKWGHTALWYVQQKTKCKKTARIFSLVGVVS